MITRIAGAFRFNTKLTRLDLLVALIATYGLVELLTPLLFGFFDETISEGTIMLRLGLGLFFSAICIPLLAARLKDMGWPPILSAVFLVPLLPEALFLLHFSTAGIHASRGPAWYINSTSYFIVAVLVLILILLAWPGRATQNSK